MRVIIPYSEANLILRDIMYIAKHSVRVIFDGDRQAVIIEYPDDTLLFELDCRGIEYFIEP